MAEENVDVEELQREAASQLMQRPVRTDASQNPEDYFHRPEIDQVLADRSIVLDTDAPLDAENMLAMAKGMMAVMHECVRAVDRQQNVAGEYCTMARELLAYSGTITVADQRIRDMQSAFVDQNRKLDDLYSRVNRTIAYIGKVGEALGLPAPAQPITPGVLPPPDVSADQERVDEARGWVAAMKKMSGSDEPQTIEVDHEGNGI